MTDPFIDDSELAIDERTFIAQTKQQGFYVFSGEVALLKEKSHRKPKSKKSALPAPEPIAGPSNYPHALSTHSQAPPQGSKDVPIALLSDGEETGGKRRTRVSAESPNGKKKRRVVDIVSVGSLSWRSPLTRPYRSSHSIPTSKPLLKTSKWPSQKVCIDLHSDPSYITWMCLAENWDQKGKFPPGIRPVLGSVALKAIKSNEYNDNFFNLMPRIFPYNRFTMSVRMVPFSRGHPCSCMRNAETHQASNFP